MCHTLLIYNYGKTFTTSDPSETIESFVNKSIDDGSIHTIGLSDTRKAAIMELKQIAPNGRVHTFIDDRTTDLQIGITINDEQKHLAVVFRGSESLKDWYYDLQVYKMNLKDDDETIKNRLENYSPIVPEITGGYQKMYVEHVMQADKGADLDFLIGKRGAEVKRHSH